ncbi:MAG: MerR family DNA-binding protein [Acidimicrobiia bacterium]|nr:MerR family DNA-binding protein [Acidimicrobiia bacterium]
MQIGEVARNVGMATSAIRFYEEAGLLDEPDRTASGYRVYDPSVINRLTFIQAGQAVGLTLNELRDVLLIRDRGEAPCRHVRELIDTRLQEVDAKIRGLRALKKELNTLAKTAVDLNPASCPPDSVCKILTSVT